MQRARDGLLSPPALADRGIETPRAILEPVATQADAVAREAVSLLTDAARAGAMRQALASVRVRLGAPGASARAARAVLGTGLFSTAIHR